MAKYVCKWGENVTYKVEIEAESVDQATDLFLDGQYDSLDVKEIDVQFDELDCVQKMDGVCDKCKKTPDGDLWAVLVTDGRYCYECACILEYEKAV